MAPSDAAPLRPLLFAERIVDLDGRAGWNGVTVARLRGTVPVEAFQRALRTLQSRHPVLRARVDRTRRRPALVLLASPPPPEVRVVARTGERHWIAATEAEFADGLDSGAGHMVRLVLLRGGDTTDLVLTVHHVACNGRTRLALMRELLKLASGAVLSEPAPSSSANLSDLFVGERLPGPATCLAARLAAAAAWPLLRIAAIRMRRRGAAETPTYVVAHIIEEAEDAALRANARSAGTTAFAALAAGLLHAFRAQRGAAFQDRLCCSVDVSRRIPGLGADDLLAVAAWADVSLGTTRGADLWADARAIKQTVTARMEGLRLGRATVLTEQMHALVPSLLEILLRRSTYQDATFSHLGSVDLPETGAPFGVEALLGSAAWVPWRRASFVYSARSAGRTTLLLVAREEHLPKAEAEAILRHAAALVVTPPAAALAAPG